MNEKKLNLFKKSIDSYTETCYMLGKIEGKQGFNIMTKKDFEIPINILRNIILEIMEKPKEPKTKKKIEIKIEKPTEIKPIKIKTTKEKEAELIKKYGKKKMEKLAKKIDFKGAILNKNNTTQEHAKQQ